MKGKGMDTTGLYIEGRRAKERLIAYNGKVQSMTAWERELGFPRSTLDNRINKLGWTVEKALTTPCKGGKN